MTIRFSTGTRTALAGATGFAATFEKGVIEIYTGTQPASADAAVSGTLLGTMTLASGAFTPGSPTNGLTFAEPANGAVAKTGTTDGSVFIRRRIYGCTRRRRGAYASAR